MTRPLVPLHLTPNKGRNRSRRLHDNRSITINPTRTLPRETKAERRRLSSLGIPTDHPRPTRRAECWEMERPCPFVGCRHHLYIEVGENGSIKLNFPDLEPHQIPQTCSLDVAEHEGVTLEGVGEITNLTRERVRQIEVIALERLERRARHLWQKR